MKKRVLQAATATAMATMIALTSSLSLAASGVELPKTIAMTAYGTGSTGYTQMVSIGNLLRNEYGTSVRILPGENDVSRMTPLRLGRVPLCACGIASYFASEGVLMFASRTWGPQPLRVITTSTASFGLGLAVAGDIGVKTPADLKGKRVAYLRGDDAINIGTEAFLAFGGLTWDDVERVTYPGYGAAFQGIIANQVDATYGSTTAPNAQQLAASPRGIVWPAVAPDDNAGWKRLNEVAPFFQRHEATAVAGEDYGPDHPWIGATYPYPIVLGTDKLDDKLAYNLIKVFTEDQDKYKDAAPGNEGYAQSQQNMEWIIPFHSAVVQYYKDTGVWTDAMQAHQDKLIERQQVLADAWKTYEGGDAPSDDAAFQKGWMKARASALKAHDMAVVFN